MMKGRKVSRRSLYSHLNTLDKKWIDRVYNQKLYSRLKLCNLSTRQIKRLYVYHHTYNSSKDFPYYGIYKPLGISRKRYNNNLFTLEEIVKLLKPRATRLFRNKKLSWYAKMGVHHRRELNLVRYPIVIRSVDTGGYEIIDGNRRIIAKSMKEGFGFKCRAYILEH